MIGCLFVCIVFASLILGVCLGIIGWGLGRVFLFMGFWVCSISTLGASWVPLFVTLVVGFSSHIYTVSFSAPVIGDNLSTLNLSFWIIKICSFMVIDIAVDDQLSTWYPLFSKMLKYYIYFFFITLALSFLIDNNLLN